jgi:hypothetical protein
VRNQMIDMWGINTKDDLMFKYLVDQKKVAARASAGTCPSPTSMHPGCFPLPLEVQRRQHRPEPVRALLQRPRRRQARVAVRGRAAHGRRS